MATLFEIESETFEAWVKERPAIIRKMIKSHPPNLLYCMASSGHRVVIYSYSENETVAVAVLGKYNRVTFERRVFGIKPSELTECDLPPEDEELGAELSSKKEIMEHLYGSNPEYEETLQ